MLTNAPDSCSVAPELHLVPRMTTPEDSSPHPVTGDQTRKLTVLRRVEQPAHEHRPKAPGPLSRDRAAPTVAGPDASG